MQRGINGIIAKMLEAACGDISFYTVLDELIKHFGGAGGVIFTMDRKSMKISNWIGPGLEDGELEYIEKLNAINPRMRYSLRHAAGHVVYDSLFTSEEKMDESEFYQVIDRLSGVRYFLGSRLFDDGDFSVFHSIEFSRKHGPPDSQKIEEFRQYSRCLGNAWKLYCSKSVGVKAGWQFPLNHLPWAVFTVDSERQIFVQNVEAQRLVSPGGMIVIDQKTIKCECSDCNAIIADGLKQVLSGQIQNLKFARDSKLASLIIQMIPHKNDNSASVVIRDTSQSFDYLDKILPDIFGLTKVEVKVVKSLARGKDISAVSVELNRSANTIRNHLRSIYKKTSSDNRAELLVQVLGLLAL